MARRSLFARIVAAGEDSRPQPPTSGLMLVAYGVLARWNKRHRLVGDSRRAHVAAVFVTVIDVLLR